jgi:hypothetical protein
MTHFISTITGQKQSFIVNTLHTLRNEYNLANYGTILACAVTVPRCSIPNVAQTVWTVVQEPVSWTEAKRLLRLRFRPARHL